MNPPVWVRDAIFYQIFPDRFANGDSTNDPPGTANWENDWPTRENFFGGDLSGIEQHIDHFLCLGVNALYLTPIFAAGSNHKYDTHDYLKIDPSFGTLETFNHLVAALKQAQIRLILDGVFNHCGDGFWAFRDVVNYGENSRYRDWFVIDSFPILFDPPTFQTCGGAPFLPKLNTNNSEVQAYLLDIVKYWVRLGIDGWRLDVPWKVATDFWPVFSRTVREVNPDTYLVAEVWRGTSDWLNGERVDGVMNYRLRQNILDFAAFNHMDAEDFDYELRQLLREHGESAPYHLTLLSSHDTPRVRTLCRGDDNRQIIAITLQMTLPGVPMIYYGDEIGMEGDNDPDCRRPMIWQQRRWNKAIFDVTRKLIHLRRTHPALRSTQIQILKVFNGIYAYAREQDDDLVIVVLNSRAVQQSQRIPIGTISGIDRWREVLTGKQMLAENGMLHFNPLHANSAYVLIPETQHEAHDS